MIRTVLRLPGYLTVLFPFLLLLGGAVCDVAISLTAVLFLVHSYVEKDWGWTKELWVRCLCLLWVYMMARGLLAEHPLEAESRSVPFIRYAVFAAALAYWTLRDELVRKYFFKALAVFVLFVACDGLLQWGTGKDLLRHPSLFYDDHTRLTGPFRSQILGAMLVWLAFPACMQFMQCREGRLSVDYRFLLAPLVLAVIALSGERMALMLALFGIAIALIVLPVRRVYLLAGVAAGFALVGAVLLASPELFQRQVFTTIDTFRNWQSSPYGELLSSDIQIAGVNPVFGIGTNHFRIVCQEIFPTASTRCNLHPHNIYMEWLIEQGIIGIGLFLAFIAALAIKCRKNWQGVKNNPVCVGLLVAVVLRLWPFASSTGIFSRWGSPPFWLIIGVFLMYVTTPSNEKSENRP